MQDSQHQIVSISGIEQFISLKNSFRTSEKQFSENYKKNRSKNDMKFVASRNDGWWHRNRHDRTLFLGFDKSICSKMKKRRIIRKHSTKNRSG